VDKIATSLGVSLIALKIEIRVDEIVHADFLYNPEPRRAYDKGRYIDRFG
jgi:hypothetical protein